MPTHTHLIMRANIVQQLLVVYTGSDFQQLDEAIHDISEHSQIVHFILFQSDIRLVDGTLQQQWNR